MRSCGDCTACCGVLGVIELDKEPFRRCEHVTPVGCGAYESRPETCRDYACEWLKGLAQRRYRPDRVGLIVDAVSGGEDGTTNTVRVREVWPGAFHSKRGREFATWLKQRGQLNVILVPFGGRKLPVGRPL